MSKPVKAVSLGNNVLVSVLRFVSNKMTFNLLSDIE